MKTNYDIMVRISEIATDPFRFELDNLVLCLDYEYAKPFLKSGTTESEWGLDKISPSEEAVTVCMRDYMQFAIEKAYGHRGLSASKSILRFRAWLWLVGGNHLLMFAEDSDNYAPYGMPILKSICDKFNFEFPKDKEIVRMSMGQPCVETCVEGCIL